MATTYLLFAIVGLLIVIFITILVKGSGSRNDLLLHQKIDSLKDDFTKNIVQSQANLVESSRALSQELGRLYEKIGGLDKESRQILQLTKSFHDILKPTKSRGILGESILENLLKDILPQEAILPQYAFKDGRRVDFAIKLPDTVVPIDAKFSLEVFRNFSQARPEEQEHQRRIFIDSIKKRIVETAGYVYPDEGTSDFALMYVPSEAVYYFIITETELLEFAQNKKVFVVGPNTLYAYLKTILLGFQAMKIEERAKEIYNGLLRLQKDMALYVRDWGVLGTHIRAAASKYDEAAKKLEMISIKLQTFTGESDDDKSAGRPRLEETAGHGL